MNKKVLVSVVLTALLGSSVFAFDFFNYNPSVSEGDKIVNVGLGLGAKPANYKIGIPPIDVAFDVIKPVAAGDLTLPLSFGGEVAVSSFNTTFKGYDDNFNVTDVKYTWLSIYAFGRVAWHFDLGVDKLDVYTGTSLGLYYHRVSASSTQYDSEGGAAFGWSGFCGARYFFKDNMAGFIEGGAGAFYLKAGLSMKL